MSEDRISIRRADYVFLRDQSRELLAALTALSNEAASWSEQDLAQIGGWTNTRCLTKRIEEARLLIEKFK